MDLRSRWDRFAGLFFLLLVVLAMVGCQAVSGGGSTPSASTQNGAISAGSTNLDFGTAVVGGTKQLTDVLSNHSSATVNIASAVSSDPAFQVTGPAMPFVLSPGQSTPLMIAFTPQAAGQPSAKISVMSTAAPQGHVDLAVSGKAVAAGDLVVSPASLTFGSVRVGQSQAQAATLTNPGGSSVVVSQDSVTSSAFTVSGLTLPLTLGAGQSAAFNVTFAPTSTGSAKANIKVNGSSSLTMSSVSGSSGPQSSKPASVTFSVAGDGTTAGQLGANPASINLGNVTVGSTQSQPVTLSNSGGTSATITQAGVVGAGLTVSGLTLPLTLGPGQSSVFQVAFAPSSTGTVSGGITLASTAANSSLSIAVTGTAVTSGSLAANPTIISFGNVTVGTSQNQPGTITNSSGTSITITAATTSGTGFSLSGLGLPMSLAPGQSAAFTVTFAPQASGNVSGSVAFASNVASLNLPLSGSGLAAGTLGANPPSVSFGNVQLGNNQAQTVTLTNGGASSVTITQLAPSGTAFSMSGISLPLTLAAGQSASFTTTFTPGSAGTATGNVLVASSATNPSLNIPLSGTGVTAGALAANPTSIAFNSVPVGSSQSHTEILSNTGGSGLQITNATVTGAGFALSGITVPTTLNAGQSLTFNVTFTPQNSAAVTGTLALTASGSVSSLGVSLSGTATAPGQLSVTPATANFGNVTVGTSTNQAASVTAGGAGVTLSNVTSSNAEFTLTGLSLPLTLSAGQTAPFTLTFKPQASGATSGTLTFTSNATNGSLTESLTGTGMPAPQHSVSLSWSESTPTVVGYNVYRGTQSGGPYEAISTGNGTGTTYTDSTVQSGQTYYYVVTAVDSAGIESVFSNQAQAVVPSP